MRSHQLPWPGTAWNMLRSARGAAIVPTPPGGPPCRRPLTLQAAPAAASMSASRGPASPAEKNAHEHFVSQSLPVTLPCEAPSYLVQTGKLPNSVPVQRLAAALVVPPPMRPPGRALLVGLLAPACWCRGSCCRAPHVRKADWCSIRLALQRRLALMAQRASAFLAR